MPRPARNVPIAMVGSVAVNGILGLGYCIMLLYSLSDLDERKQTLYSRLIGIHEWPSKIKFDILDDMDQKAY